MKRSLFLTVCLLTAKISVAQQDKQFTHYMYDKMSYNPAATGFNGYCATIIYRNQWDRVERAPNSTLVNVQGNFPQQNLGLGISFTNDAIGFQRNNTMLLNGAYHFGTSAGVLSAGFGAGIINVGFSPDWVPPQTYVDPNLPAPLSGSGLDMNFGLHWYGKHKPYYVGFSTTHLSPATMQSINYQVARHYYVLGGYNFHLPYSKIDLKPSILIKADGATSIFDFNTTADYWLNNYSFLWGGFSYRLQDAVALNVGYAFSPSRNTKLSMVKIGYSFDIMTNALNTYGKGTHELMLNLCVFPPRLIGSHGNPFILQ